MTTEDEIEAACAAFEPDWASFGTAPREACRRRMRAALEAAAAVREQPMSTYQDAALAALANTDERLKRMLVIIAKQSSGDEGAIPDMVVNAIGEAEYDRLCDEITDDEVRGLAYPYG